MIGTGASVVVFYVREFLTKKVMVDLMNVIKK